MSRFQTYANMLKSLGHPLTPETRMLDFGCGGGELVKAAHQMGLDAYGCDFNFESEWIEQKVLADLQSSNRVRKIQTTATSKVSPGEGEPYRLPFDDATFDVIISDQVLEHVQNYAQTLAELKRILKPDGVMLHMFPSRYRLIEPHVMVPLASFFRPYWWLRLWAGLGVRNQYQREKGFSARETADENAEWLPRMTNYLTMGEIRREFERHFAVSSEEGKFMAQSQRARVFLLPALYRTFQSRCVACITSADQVPAERVVDHS